VAGVYNRSELLPNRRAALERWAQHVTGIVTGKPGQRGAHARAQAIGGTGGGLSISACPLMAGRYLDFQVVPHANGKAGETGAAPA
jgi:hypothetical protein